MKNKNQETANRLDAMELSPKAREVIANTEIRIMHEVFGNMQTPEEVEQYITENYPE